jgi:hypothetical protein
MTRQEKTKEPENKIQIFQAAPIALRASMSRLAFQQTSPGRLQYWPSGSASGSGWAKASAMASAARLTFQQTSPGRLHQRLLASGSAARLILAQQVSVLVAGKKNVSFMHLFLLIGGGENEGESTECFTYHRDDHNIFEHQHHAFQTPEHRKLVVELENYPLEFDATYRKKKLNEM